jgi:hypothetical protein
MKISESKKSLTLLAFIIIGTFLLSSILSYRTAKQTLKQEVRSSSLPLLSENIYSDLQNALSVPIHLSSSMARDAFLINWINGGEKDPEELQLYLKNMRDKYNFLTTFYVSEQSRHYY